MTNTRPISEALEPVYIAICEGDIDYLGAVEIPARIAELLPPDAEGAAISPLELAAKHDALESGEYLCAVGQVGGIEQAFYFAAENLSVPFMEMLCRYWAPSDAQLSAALDIACVHRPPLDVVHFFRERGATGSAESESRIASVLANQ